jgi:hypothetical protein
MLNKTKSKIIINMKHIDHSNKLFEALKEIKDIAEQGGDFIIKVDNQKFNIGHDVIIKNIEHIIFRK